ncbi:hypothetical protein [Bowmanella dokdonensis]|uniref:Uncharacterized protein n=1 Tax=Bowmanella dokdonensis TaxID=751969 RepID=A0A939DQY1_9ALTE|nr:hypothetical protein [Bowmanella dokdonensis]MBN7826600.1 hypothetical protein [Bowmanella dokdonensis]
MAVIPQSIPMLRDKLKALDAQLSQPPQNLDEIKRLKQALEELLDELRLDCLETASK